ncbi:MAG TPA: hypothetical protein GX713_03365 [Mollicutes bacterium]|nr:hypothetical protein [Mollicutes bacterium]
MGNRVFISMVIIVLAVFSLLTYYKLKEMPEDNCCIDMKVPTDKSCYDCQNYNLAEKIVYVWKYS